MEYEFDKIWERVKRVTGWKRQAQLAAFLDIQAVNISKSKKEGVFREGWILKLAEGYDLNVKWLIHGEGPVYAKNQDKNEPLTNPQPKRRGPANRGHIDLRDDYYRLDYEKMAHAVQAVAAVEEMLEGRGYKLAKEKKGLLLDAIAQAMEAPSERRKRRDLERHIKQVGANNIMVEGSGNTINGEGTGGDGRGDK